METGSVLPARRKLDVETLYRMADAGIFSHKDRIELIDGDIIDMAPIGSDHIATVTLLTRLLVLAFREDAVVSVQMPIRIDTFNEPQPDLAIYRPRADDYRTAPRAGPEDALLVIEVADSSLRYDRSVKLPLYARAGCAEYWIVDLRTRVVTAYTEPVGDDYARIRSFGQGETLSPGLAPTVTIAVDAILGRPPRH